MEGEGLGDLVTWGYIR